MCESEWIRDVSENEYEVVGDLSVTTSSWNCFLQCHKILSELNDSIS